MGGVIAFEPFCEKWGLTFRHVGKWRPIFFIEAWSTDNTFSDTSNVGLTKKHSDNLPPFRKVTTPTGPWTIRGIPLITSCLFRQMSAKEILKLGESIHFMKGITY